MRRFPDGVPDKGRAMVEYVLALIAEPKYEPYFLTVHDMSLRPQPRHPVPGARLGGQFHGARRIADHRSKPGLHGHAVLTFHFARAHRAARHPWYFEHERREEAIQYLYAKYGRDAPR